MSIKASMGKASIWRQDENGVHLPCPSNLLPATDDADVLVMQMWMDSGERFSVVFRRGEFSAMLAGPNGLASPIECAIAAEDEE